MIGYEAAQAKAETASRARSGATRSIMHDRGHRSGWQEAIEWVVRAAGPIDWDARVIEVWGRLWVAGIARTGVHVNNAIDSARQKLHADDCVWYDPDTRHGWEVLEPHVYEFLDLTDDELAEVA